jgi:hypothetical protein
MMIKRSIVLFGVLGFAAVLVVASWLASSRIKSQADVAARAAPPTPSPILVPVEQRVLSSNIVTRGTARFGLPQPVSIAPSALKTDAGLIATLPLPNTQFVEGDVILTASGRPLFVIQGKSPAYRDLVPGISGDDVLQLEQALKRLGFAPGRVDGAYDQRTSAAVAKWYKSSGWEPFGPTREQLDKVKTLEQEWGDARKRKMAADGTAAAAVLAVEAARAVADRNDKAAVAELEARRADWIRLKGAGKDGTPSAVEVARAIAEHNNKAAATEVATQISARALIVLDPRQPETARKTAEAKLELARAAARKAQMEGELAIQAAKRETKLAAEKLELAEAAVKSTHLENEMAIQTALDALKVAELDAELSAHRADRLAADLVIAKRKLGLQVPVDEIVFIPAMPVRVKDIMAHVGDPARGNVMTVTDNQLAIDSSLPLDAALLVKRGMPVSIDEEALGVKATGVVERVASTPGTNGVDGYHIYFAVRVTKTSTRLEGFSLRLTIPIESSNGVVTVVPISALSLAADGTSRVQVENNGVLEYMAVKPGLSANGYVEVTPVEGTLKPGQLVLVGYENPENRVSP